MLLQIQHIIKRFPGVLANDHISFDVRKGEIHAIVGENGAGKTTLMKILYGLYRPDDGEICWKGVPVRFQSPRDAIAHGIGMVHQHFMLVPTLTVAENVMLGCQSLPESAQARETGFWRRWLKRALLDVNAAEQRIASLSECFGLAVDPKARISDLSVGARQRVEIIKALYRNAELLILDEPTSVLTPQETSECFRILKTLVKLGMSVIFITHKLQEVMESSDRATVLRGGRVINTVNVADITQRELAQMMVGRGVLERLNKSPQSPGAEVLRVERLTCVAQEQTVVRDMSFTLHAGEILGIAGVAGNGQSELTEMLAGLRCASSGNIYVAGQAMTNCSPRRRILAGMAHIPEERQKMGVVMDLTLRENGVLGAFFQPSFSSAGWMNHAEQTRHARHLLSAYDVKASDIRASLQELSGGNQQKFVVGRELSKTPKLLLAIQPTRGVDIGATEYIHQQLLAERARGVAILLISTELDEIFALSDRIGVMYRGELAAIAPAEHISRETIGLLMTGVR